MMTLVRSRLALVSLGAVLLVVFSLALVAWFHLEAQAQQLMERESAERQDDGRFLIQLRERRDTLDEREAQLNEFTQRLEKWEEELREREQALGQPGGVEETDPCLERDEGEREERLGGLARSLQSMKPEVASQMLVELPPLLAVQLLEQVNPRNRARIFDRMSAEDSARLGSLFVGHQEGE